VLCALASAQFSAVTDCKETSHYAVTIAQPLAGGCTVTQPLAGCRTPVRCPPLCIIQALTSRPSACNRHTVHRWMSFELYRMSSHFRASRSHELVSAALGSHTPLRCLHSSSHLHVRLPTRAHWRPGCACMWLVRRICALVWSMSTILIPTHRPRSCALIPTPVRGFSFGHCAGALACLHSHALRQTVSQLYSAALQIRPAWIVGIRVHMHSHSLDSHFCPGQSHLVALTTRSIVTHSGCTLLTHSLCDLSSYADRFVHALSHIRWHLGMPMHLRSVVRSRSLRRASVHNDYSFRFHAFTCAHVHKRRCHTLLQTD